MTFAVGEGDVYEKESCLAFCSVGSVGPLFTDPCLDQILDCTALALGKMGLLAPPSPCRRHTATALKHLTLHLPPSSPSCPPVVGRLSLLVQWV